MSEKEKTASDAGSPSPTTSAAADTNEENRKPDGKNLSPSRLFLDRIEGDVAVLLKADGDESEIEVDRGLLPDRVREGDWLRVETDGRGKITYHVDHEAGTAAKSRVQNLMDELS